MNEAITQLQQLKDALESDADQLDLIESAGSTIRIVDDVQKSLRSKAHQIGEFISHVKGESEEATPS